MISDEDLAGIKVNKSWIGPCICEDYEVLAIIARLEAAETELARPIEGAIEPPPDVKGPLEFRLKRSGDIARDTVAMLLFEKLQFQAERDAAHAKIAKVAAAIEPYCLELTAAGRTGILATDAVGLLVAEREELKRKLAEAEKVLASPAIQSVIKERENQVAHGYDAAHDDTHTDGAIAQVAEQLIHHSDPEIQYRTSIGKGGLETRDPRHPSQWHLHIIAKWKHDKRKMLTIAAALLMAEIERLCRVESDAALAARLISKTPPTQTSQQFNNAYLGTFTNGKLCENPSKIPTCEVMGGGASMPGEYCPEKITHKITREDKIHFVCSRCAKNVAAGAYGNGWAIELYDETPPTPADEQPARDEAKSPEQDVWHDASSPPPSSFRVFLISRANLSLAIHECYYLIGNWCLWTHERLPSHWKPLKWIEADTLARAVMDEAKGGAQ